MKENGLIDDIEMIIISLSVTVFTLGYTSFILLVSIYCFLKFRRLKYPYILIFLFLSVLVTGTTITLFNILISKYEMIYVPGMLYRIRFFWIRIIFALAILAYIYRLSYENILKFIYYMAIPCTIAGLFQLIDNPARRVVMLTTEASAAGMYYIFMLPLLLEYYKINKKAKFWIILFIIVGLFIRSKAQILVLPLMLIYFIFKSENKKLKRGLFIVFLVLFFLMPLILKLDQLKNLNYFISVLYEEGVSGLTEKNQIWSTFTLRFSSFLTAIQLFGDNLLGCGFGTFHPEYIFKMTSDSLQSQMTGIEIASTLKNELYATPKSIFFEYLVSTGLFFLIPIGIIIVKYFKSDKSTFIKASLYGLLMVSLLVELSPFLIFLTISMVIFYKTTKEA